MRGDGRTITRKKSLVKGGQALISNGEMTCYTLLIGNLHSAASDGKLTAWVDPDTCIDCGACAPECPTDAIFAEDKVPEQYKEWIDKNRAFYADGPGYSANA